MTAERGVRLARAVLVAILAGCSGGPGAVIGPPEPHGGNGPPWFGYARDAQHTALSVSTSQPIGRIHWHTPVDLAPQYAFGELLAHYGSPVVTRGDMVIVPVKTGASGGFRVEAHDALNGALVWRFASDYALPAHQWTPSFNPALALSGRLYFPGSGGKLFYRDDPDSPRSATKTAVFYGAAAYAAHKALYDRNVFIDTPITTDDSGDVYFGYVVTGATPAGLASGIAHINPAGQGSWVSAATSSGDASMTEVAMNGAPALAPDLHTVYVAVSNGSNGYLLALDSTTLATKGKASLLDPQSGQPAWISDNSSASPTIGPDGDVYYGVLEAPFPGHNDRGWLLHFDASLGVRKTPGSFGWDSTASLVPSSMVPSYAGTSPYLLMTKYNNYAGIGTGDGLNRIAILDPDAIEEDPISGISVMHEVLTRVGVTPDPDHPGGVREWCINTAAVDPATKSVFANSEDGYLYRWDLASNTLASRVALTSGVGESYTPTSIGPDGQVYAINNAVLFAIGQ